MDTTTTSDNNSTSGNNNIQTTTTQNETTTSSIQFVMEQLIACQISVWYPIFSNILPLLYNNENKLEQQQNDQTSNRKIKVRKNVTIRSIILNVPYEFIQYMKQDGLILPDNIQSSLLLLQSTSKSSTTDPTNLDINTNTSPFQVFHQKIDNAITTLYKNYILDDTINDRAILPKFNWSAPKDSIWINTGTMKCCTVGDIYILVKASDFISNDIHYTIPEINNYYYSTTNNNNSKNLNDTNNDNNNLQIVPQQKEQQDKVQVQLCLRKWCYLYRCQEFRCFISNTVLLGICQRDTTQYYNHLQSLQKQEKIICIIQEFLVAIIIPTIKKKTNNDDDDDAIVLSTLLHRCIMDVYIDTKDTIWLIDFNVWDRTRTDSLLFTWDEIESLVSLSAKTTETAAVNTIPNNTKLVVNNENDNIVPLQEKEEQEGDIFYRIKFGKCSVSKDDDNNTVSDGNDNDSDSDSDHQVNDDDDSISLSSIPIFRVVEIDKEVRVDPLSSYRAPIDTLYVASATTKTTTPKTNTYGPVPLPTSSSTSSSSDNQKEQDTPTQFDPKCFDQFMKLCYAPGEEDEDENAEASSTSTNDDDDENA